VGAKLWWKDGALSPDLRGGADRSSLVRAEPVDEGVPAPAVRRLLEAVDDDSLGVLGRLAGRATSGRWKLSSASSSSSSFSAAASCSNRCRPALGAFLGAGAGASASISSSASCSSTVLGGILDANRLLAVGDFNHKDPTPAAACGRVVVPCNRDHGRQACLAVPGPLVRACHWRGALPCAPAWLAFAEAATTTRQRSSHQRASCPVFCMASLLLPALPLVCSRLPLLGALAPVFHSSS
jgi:hypothetical protein